MKEVFKEDRAHKVYFHVGLHESINYRHEQYGRYRTFSDVAYILEGLFESQKKKEASQNNDVLEAELTRLENEVINKRVFMPNLRIRDFATPDLAKRYGMQFIEALVPLDKILEHTNGRVKDGVFEGYEAMVSELLPENILHVSDKVSINDWEGIMPLSTQQLLATYKEVPNAWEVIRAAEKEAASL